MLTLAYSALFKLKENAITDESIVDSTRIVNLACLELCDGQSLDLQYEDRLDITTTDYLDMAAKKTAALFAASTSLGAYLGSRDARLENAFHLFGKELGMAYQIRDDIMGIWETEESTGKSASDITQKKKTLPVVYALRSSNGRARQMLEKLYSQQSIQVDDIALVTKILDDLGAKNYAEDLAEQYYRRAVAQLAATKLDPASQAPLIEMARFFLKRDF
jgi:geranylgeranyl diphosphate synthase type I